MDRTRVVYFLEDIAQEGFVKAIVTRIAGEQSIQPESLQHDVRSSPGSRAVKAFHDFVNRLKLGVESLPDVLVVAVDGNCSKYQWIVRELGRCFEPSDPLRDRTVYAVPDPHIERWYLVDQRAFKDSTGGSPPPLPPYKCEKGPYKSLLNQGLKNAGIRSQLGGAEYGERIAGKVDLNALAEKNAGFGTFVQELRRILRSSKSCV